MAGQADFINILREIRGSAAPGQPLTDGIWYELTVADKNGNAGVYGDILAKYGVVTESAGTFDQAVAILENLNVEVTTLPAGSQATSALVDGTWRIGIPKGLNGIDGIDGKTPNVGVSYSGGNLKYTVTVDGVVVTDSNILNLDSLVDSVVSSNIGVLDTLVAKQEVLDSVATVHGLVESFDSNVIAKQQEINDYTFGKLAELDSKSNSEKAEIAVYSNSKIVEFNSAATAKINQYDSNHTSKLATYNMNGATKIAQYNDNHEARLEEINYAYADRIIEMIKTRNFMGIMDEYVAKTDTHMIEFLDTVNANYIYYANGMLLTLGADYTVYNSTTLELTNKTNPYDVIVQINTTVLNNMFTAEGILFEDRVGQANGIAGLDSTGKVPASQLPSYVDDVIEVATKSALPSVGESGKIYIVVADESSNGDTSTYRWAGSVYAVVSNTLTAADVKSLYESNSNTNAYTDTAKLIVDKLSWNADESTLDIALGAATLQVGQEQLIRVTNNSGTEITNGMAVIATGTLGNSGRITVAKANLTQANAKFVLGVVTETIANGADGFVTTFGKVRGIQTNGGQYGETWLDGDVLYVKDSGNGALTKVIPSETQVKLPVAIVINSHGSNGSLFIRVNSIDENAIAKRADKLTTARSITLTGDVTGTLTFDGSANTSMSTTITANSVVLGTDTTGNYVAGVTQGTGIAVTGTAGEGWSPTIALTNVGTAGTYRSVTTDAQGRVTGGTNPTTLAGYGITDVYTKTESNTNYEPKNTNIQSHISSTSNPHNVTKTQVGLGDVDNTSDANKPISTAQQSALNLKANIASPTFTGTPATPTASVGTSTTQIASTAFVIAEINKIEEW